MIDAVAFMFRTGSQWVYLPERYGNRRGVCSRLLMWAVDGTWEGVFTALMAQADADEDLNWAVSVDSTIVRAHPLASDAHCRPLGLRSHRRTGRRRTRLSGRDGPTPRPSPTRAAPDQAGHGSGRQAFDREAYEQRNTVERCINRLKQWHGIATR